MKVLSILAGQPWPLQTRPSRLGWAAVTAAVTAGLPAALNSVSTAVCLALLAAAGSTNAQPTPPLITGGTGTPPLPTPLPGGSLASPNQPGKPGQAPPVQQPQLPTRPFDAKPLQPIGPQVGGNPNLKVACPPDGDPLKLTLEVTPKPLRSGMPVELRLSTQCPVKNQQLVEFTGFAPGVTDRAAGDTLVAFLNQIPRTYWQPGSSAHVVSVTPRGLAASFSFNLKGRLSQPRVIFSNEVAVPIQGNGSSTDAPQPASAAAPTSPRCDPSITLNAIPTAVIGGANVPVDISFSCALTVESVVQIISSNEALLPRPPGGTVRMPANTQRMQFSMQAARAGSGTVTLRAVLSQPAGRMSEPDSVIVQNN